MHIKDSLTGAIKPVSPSYVSIYACGITPYSSAHVGHARTYVVFDLLARVLRAQGHVVDLARNITDIDDKIISAAQAQGRPWYELANHYAQENRDLMQATGVAVPLEPKASEHLPQIFALVRELLDKGLAYQADNGDVLYRVSAYHGQLLMRHKEGSLRSEQGDSRVAATKKEDARDFALWKRMPEDAVGFESPWGWGRPGWHIECSAMIGELFGGAVTIHGGGVDLKFPHHQAEIMQSEPVFGRPLADIWMHNGSVLSDGQKMSKSLGNFVTWRAALDMSEALAPGQGGTLLRVALLQAHWQKPLDWKDDLLKTTRDELVRLSRAAVQAPVSAGIGPDSLLMQLDDNLNTPAAWVQLRTQAKAGRHAELHAGLNFLGVDVGAWAQLGMDEAVSEARAVQIAQLQALRTQARQNKDWALADALREQLRALGAEVQDTRTRR